MRPTRAADGALPVRFLFFEACAPSVSSHNGDGHENTDPREGNDHHALGFSHPLTPFPRILNAVPTDSVKALNGG